MKDLTVYQKQIRDALDSFKKKMRWEKRYGDRSDLLAISAVADWLADLEMVISPFLEYCNGHSDDDNLEIMDVTNFEKFDDHLFVGSERIFQCRVCSKYRFQHSSGISLWIERDKLDNQIVNMRSLSKFYDRDTKPDDHMTQEAQEKKIDISRFIDNPDPDVVQVIEGDNCDHPNTVIIKATNDIQLEEMDVLLQCKECNKYQFSNAFGTTGWIKGFFALDKRITELRKESNK